MFIISYENTVDHIYNNSIIKQLRYIYAVEN
jgi:hypothetical protein